MQQDIKQILLHYGKEHQKAKVIEELSELIRAIVCDDRDNIVEEIADVEIMIEQLKMIYLVDGEEVENVKKEKIEKVIFKIKNSNTYKG